MLGGGSEGWGGGVGRVRRGSVVSEAWGRFEGVEEGGSDAVCFFPDGGTLRSRAAPVDRSNVRAARPLVGELANKFTRIPRSYRNVCSSVFVSQDIYGVLI